MRVSSWFWLAGLAPAFFGPLLAQGDWPGYGKDPFGQRHSPLTQINTANVAKLKPAWHYGVDPKAVNNDSSLSADQKQTKIKQIHKSTRKEVAAILTPEQKKTMREWRRAHR